MYDIDLSQHTRLGWYFKYDSSTSEHAQSIHRGDLTMANIKPLWSLNCVYAVYIVCMNIFAFALFLNHGQKSIE